MKATAKRTGFALVLAAILLFGLLTFFIRYFLYADRWVSFPGSPHVYSRNGSLETGEILDRSGKVLYSTQGNLRYAEDSLTRRAMLHLLGDKEGNIPARVLRNYTSMLVGFDKLNGTYAMDRGGGEIRTTVSAQVQGIALQALDGRKGTVGVYNYKTGEILCAVSSPTFDPESPPDVAGDTTGKYDGVYVYRFFHSTYTPGSIFKLTTTAAALESVPGVETMRFTCTGSVTVNGERITCSKAHGEQSYADALANSCNCAFAQITQLVGRENLARKVREIRLSDSMEFDGIHTAAGHFDLSGADDNALAWAGIGQYTDLINPCQYMVYMGAISNGGRAAEPFLVSRVKRGGGVRYERELRQTAQMLTPAAAETLKEMMRNNTEKMYQSAQIKGMTVCAKSGTAQVGEGRSTALFTGFLDSEEYPLAFIVVVEEGGAGSSNAGPIAKTVLQACVNVLNGER